MSLKEEVFGYFVGTLCLVIHLVFDLGKSEGTCPNGTNVTSWSGWTCNIERSTATRAGNCKDDTHPNETVNVTVYSWTSWSPWSPTGGVVEVHRSRSCVVPSPDSLYCSTCGYENTTEKESKPSNLPPCCEDYPFGSWSSWFPSCSPDDTGGKYIDQSRTRERNCSDSSNCTLCPIEMQTRRVILQSWSKWRDTLIPCSEKTSETTDHSLSTQIPMTDASTIAATMAFSSWSTSPPKTVYSTSPNSLSSPEPVRSNSIECPSSALPYTPPSVTSTPLSTTSTPPSVTSTPPSAPSTPPSVPSIPPSVPSTSPSTTSTVTPPSANDTSVPVYIWTIIGVSGVGVTLLMIIGAILLLICCYVKKFRQRHDEILYGHIVLRDGSNSPTTLHGEDSGRTPLLSMDGYQDQNRDGSSSESSVGTGNGGRLSFDEFTDSEQDGGHLGECREPPLQGESTVIPDEVIWPKLECTSSNTIVVNKSYEESSSVESVPQLEELALLNSRDHPQMVDDTTGGEFVDVTEQVGENEQSGIELPYEGFLIEEKRNTREEEYKNIKTTSDKRPSTEKRPHPKLFESDDDDDDEDEMFAL